MSPIRAAVPAAVAMVVVALVAVLLGRGAVDRLLPQPPCSARVGEVEVRLERDQAEQAAALAATAVRKGAARPPETDVVALALQGYAPAAFTCQARPASASGQQPGGSGLTLRAAEALRAIEAAFGEQSVGGFDPMGVSSGHMDGSAHYSGRAVDVFYRPITKANRREGWATAQWLVANAQRLELATVIYDGKIWTARRSAQGWRDYTPPGGPTKNATLMHRDHVHLDVA
ncbi:MAG: hypothetical protein ACT4QG_01230 [Sporichthyaceae bacterium]